MNAATRTGCERFRGQVSLLVDGQLSELERKMLAVHVRRCAGCATFHAGVVEATERLRTAPAERLPEPVRVARPRAATLRRLAPVGVAATVVFGALGLAGQLATPQLGADTAFRVNHQLFQATWRPEVEQAQVAKVPKGVPRLQGAEGRLPPA